ncbi:MAG: hypothetical protein K0S82_675 [Gaiellaceae bacterium]|nr:hypothetical protein [Gaiellaceae bacterium]
MVEDAAARGSANAVTASVEHVLRDREQRLKEIEGHESRFVIWPAAEGSSKRLASQAPAAQDRAHHSGSARSYPADAEIPPLAPPCVMTGRSVASGS